MNNFHSSIDHICNEAFPLFESESICKSSYEIRPIVTFVKCEVLIRLAFFARASCLL